MLFYCTSTMDDLMVPLTAAFLFILPEPWRWPIIGSPMSPQNPTNPGLCATCRHLRPVQSQRGSAFFMCRRAATDQHFPKYPPLPVLSCPGYEAAEIGRASNSGEG